MAQVVVRGTSLPVVTIEGISTFSSFLYVLITESQGSLF